jgi:hypothetical protein
VTVIAARCGDGQVLDAWRRDGYAGTVHSVFARVVNIVDASGRLVSLAVRSLDNAPGTLIVDLADFRSFSLRPGTPARTRREVLYIDEPRLAVRFDRAAAWHAGLPEYPRDDMRLRENLAAVRPCIVDAAPLLEAHAPAIVSAMRRRDVDGVCTHGRGLLGLGPGLTPSGDDFLVGLFAVLNLAGSPCHGLRRACDDILAGAEARTHAISLAALREAARGRVRDSLQVLLRELMSGRAESLRDALARVLAIGETSGRDIVSGIVCGLTANVTDDPPLGRRAGTGDRSGVCRTRSDGLLQSRCRP